MKSIYIKIIAILSMIFFFPHAHGQKVEIDNTCIDSIIINDSVAHGMGIAVDTSQTKAKSMAFFHAIINLTNQLEQHIKMVNDSVIMYAIGTTDLFETPKPIDKLSSKLFRTPAWGIDKESESFFFMNISWINFISTHAEIVCEQELRNHDRIWQASCLIRITDYPKDWLLLLYYDSIRPEKTYHNVEINEEELKNLFNKLLK